MTSQATIDYAAELHAKVNKNTDRITVLSAQPLTSETRAELRKLKNSNASIQNEFVANKDLANYALSKTKPSERLGLLGIGLGAPALLPVAVIAKSNEQKFTVEPASHAKTPDSPSIEIAAAPVHALNPLPNVLQAYPSYTYGISLHALSSLQYNNVVKDQKYLPEHVLIASAGRRDNISGTFPRSEFFNEDFYFTNLNMTTVIGLNARSRATNAITLNFSINEPYGITLLNRIIDVAGSLSVANYIDMPYLLQIDFFGIDDAGEIVGIIPGITKYIPIKLIKMDIKTGVNGTEYVIQAVPFNHAAFEISAITTPANFEVTASSVQSFFEESVTERNKVNDQIREQERIDSHQCSFADPTIKIKSYTSAINAHYIDIGTRHGMVGIDTYTFEFHDEIKAAGTFFLSRKNVDVKNTAMANDKTANANRQSNAGISMLKTATFASDVQVFSINNGTSIDTVLNYVIKNSDYIQSQMNVPEDANGDQIKFEANKKNKNQPLRWFKIISQITLGEYDVFHNKWARTINYKIIPYDVYNAKTDEAPQGVTETPLKVYNYYHTGKNTDILNLDIDFNCMYYTAITAYRTNAARTTSFYDDGLECKVDYPKESNNPNSLTVMRKKYETAITRAGSGTNVTTTRDVAIQDTEQSMLIDAGADMLNVKLKIIGDPLFIKQDDIFYSPRMTTAPDQVDSTGIDTRLTANGSFTTDTGEVYVQISFRSPSDIDDVTGMMKYDANYQESVFSGMYRVLTVDNNFAGGQFTQTLNLVRLPRQTKYDYTAKGAKINQKDQDANRPIIAQQNNVQGLGATNTTIMPDPNIKAPGGNIIPPILNSTITQEQQKLMNLGRKL